MQIFLLSGKARSGKDTVADILEEQFINKKVLRIAYADDVKYICKTYLGWDGEKDETGRTLLQEVGTILGRGHLGENYWVDRVKDILFFSQNRYDVVIITDCRFPNEIEVIQDAYKGRCTSIRVERPNHQSGLNAAQMEHISETALDDYEFDFEIMNDGSLDDLSRKINNIINKYKKVA